MQQFIFSEPQVVKDRQGTVGVFIPLREWERIRVIFPEIEAIGDSLPRWERNFIDSRLDAVSRHPERLKPIDSLFDDV